MKRTHFVRKLIDGSFLHGVKDICSMFHLSRNVPVLDKDVFLETKDFLFYPNDFLGFLLR